MEQSFGNYVGSNVMQAAKEELEKIQHEIELLSVEVTEDAIDRKCQEQLSENDYAEISKLQEELRVSFSCHILKFEVTTILLSQALNFCIDL